MTKQALAAIDLNNASMEELLTLEKEAQALLTKIKQQKKKRARTQLKKLANDAGITVQELINTAGVSKKRRSTGVAKYEHPTDPTKTWSGKGRQPQWLKELLTQGKTLEELRS